ncbi:MAG TPA: hypothetical protein VLL72_08170 [Kiloniellales bacterium]|nr:hypothetical protein [Kiloniellales bacterium]
MTDELAAATRTALIALAREGRCATYRELAAQVPVPPPHSIHRLTLTLEDLAREDHAAGRPLVSALAVSRARPGLPGRGFFQLLRELGRYDGPDSGPEAAAAHSAELQRALDYWGATSGEG